MFAGTGQGRAQFARLKGIMKGILKGILKAESDEKSLGEQNHYVLWQKFSTSTKNINVLQKKLERERFKDVRGHRAGARSIRSPLTICVRTL